MSFDKLLDNFLLRGRLPRREEEWLEADTDGWSMAHAVASRKCMAADFPYWDVVDNNGTTVAHAALRSGCLPADFKQWDLQDGQGNTVLRLFTQQRLNHCRQILQVNSTAAAS